MPYFFLAIPRRPRISFFFSSYRSSYLSAYKRHPSKYLLTAALLSKRRALPARTSFTISREPDTFMPLAISWNKVLRRLCEHSTAQHVLTMFDENFIPFHPLTAYDVSAALPGPASAVQVMVDGCESCARDLRHPSEITSTK